MADGDHERGKREGQFCAIPANPKCIDCPGSETYIKVCEPKSWNTGYAYLQLVRAKIKPYTFDKIYEAHHIACVSPVSAFVAGDSELKDVVHQSKWCINKESNMLAMPLFGHTVKWYCTIMAASDKVQIDASAQVPPFKDIPQHNFDHNGPGRYTSEVEDAVKKLAEKCKKANKEHKLAPGDLAALMDRVSKGFKTMLDKRGHRKGGTHAAWGLAQQATPDSQWSQPFSMASDAQVSKIGFPVRTFNQSVAKWVARIAKAMKGP